MHYRKFAADRLFTGVSMLEKNAVLITDDSGTIVGITEQANAGEGIEQFRGILCPGFINCHCHLELSHLQGLIPRQTGMTDFLLAVMKERMVDMPHIVQSIERAELSMWESGIAAVGDICNTGHTLTAKTNSRLYYHNFIETAGFTDETAAFRFNQALETLQKFEEIGADTRSTASIVPHAPYSVSEKLLQLINEFRQGSLLSIHNQESEAESEFFLTGEGAFPDLFRQMNIDTGHFTGKADNSLIHSLKRISSEHSLILVHNVHTSESDLDWISGNKHRLPELYWCLCPNANLYINGKLPHVQMLKERDCKLVVGTDSLASNSQLNILDELISIQEHFHSLPLEELLQWATSNGAAALRIGHTHGSFEKGKRPGVVVINMENKERLSGAKASRIL